MIFKLNICNKATHLNIAMCQIKLGDYTAAREECDNALELDVNNVKAVLTLILFYCKYTVWKFHLT
jgi:Tfp pilus assembly protein PilF